MKDNQKDNQKVQLKGQLKMYMQWPGFMAVLLVAMDIWVYRIDRRAGLLMFLFVAIYIFMASILYFYGKSLIMKDLIEFAVQYGMVQNTLLRELAVPYAMLLDDGRMVWKNEQFEKILGKRHSRELYLSKCMPELNRSIFPREENDVVEMDVYYEDREYKAELRKVSVAGFNETEKLLELPEKKEHFIAVHLQDMTELNRYIKENEEQRLIAGLIYIDNYDEVIGSVEEVRQSLLVALVDRKINQYIGRVDGIVKKTETDKYFIVLKKQYFKELEEDKFSLLEDVKTVNIGNSIPVTLSIGLGLSREAYAQSNNYARVAIDLALARGGDQAVIKEGSGITYYGGKREQASRNTRVKARVKAEALREFITMKDRIFVMGHKLMDVDSFGAAIGVCRAATVLGKRAQVILNEVSASLRPIYNKYVEDSNYPEDMFLTSEEVLALADENSLVIVVDTSRPKMTECEELLHIAKTIVVLDHHRQSSDNIDNAVLSYIEPYASSACEMISEVLQYIVDDVRIPRLEASSMYAGIMIDTNNFVNRTGVRTLEAAAFLRRSGADITLIRKMLRDDLESYQAKAEIIRSAEVYHEKFAIARGERLNVESPTIIGAQAANELLDISAIKASFVLTEYNGRIYVSARSIDEVNVQVIMERMGGGGHLNASGAQFDHTDMEKAVESVKQVLDDMIRKGDI